MPSRYITGQNCEIQLRNCFSSMLNAIHNEYHDKFTILSKKKFSGVDYLEFKYVDGHNMKIDYQNTYRLNGRFDLTISGECFDNCFTVLLMITDRQTKARFGFTVKVYTDLSREEAFHIVANIPVFGIHLHIKYNPDTKFFVVGCRDPFDIEEEVESGTTTCLNVDFVNDRISDDVFFGRFLTY